MKTKKINIIMIGLLAAAAIIAAFWGFDYFRAPAPEDQVAADTAQLSGFARAEGKEILDLLLVLQRIKLDISFFQNPDFIKLMDFYKEIKILEEEKGKQNPFKRL